MKSQETDYVHFLGLEISDHQALMLATFKKKNRDLMDRWFEENAWLKNIPPIYWDSYKEEWMWCPINKKDLFEYMFLCEALVRARLKARKPN